MTVHTLYSTGLRSGLLGGHVSEVRRLVSQQLGKSRHNVSSGTLNSTIPYHHQQLDRYLAATVWEARHRSNMHHSLSSLAAWKPQPLHWRHHLKPTPRNMFIRNQWGMSMSWNGIWLKCGQQPAELHWLCDWSVLRSFYRVSQTKSKHSEYLLCRVSAVPRFSVTVVTFKAYVTAILNKLTCFVSPGRVRTAIRKGGHFYCSFVANLLPNIINSQWFDKVIAKIKRVQLFCLTVQFGGFYCCSITLAVIDVCIVTRKTVICK